MEGGRKGSEKGRKQGKLRREREGGRTGREQGGKERGRSYRNPGSFECREGKGGKGKFGKVRKGQWTE